jgi:glycosyltransferase involved in cell wall biosynthesis
MPEKRERIRVLTLIDIIWQAGGAERLAIELTRRLDPERFERTLFVTRWDPRLHEAPVEAGVLASLADGGVSVSGVERSGRLAPRAWQRLWRELRERRIDVVHAHKFGANVWGAVVGRLAGVPVVIAHEHSWAFEGSHARRLIDRHVVGRLADAVIAVSDEDRRRIVEIERVPEDKVRFIPTGMPPVPQVGPPGDVRAELGLGEAPVIGSVCCIRPEKALPVLIRAAALLAPRFPGLQVVIAGDGDSQELRDLAEELGVGDRVRLLGFRADVASVLAALDVAVNTSDREGSPLSIMEYMEAGLPVVATRVGGTPDLVAEGETGLLVEPRDPAGLADAIAGLLEDRERAREMGRRGRERRRSLFDLERMVADVEALYDELLEARRAGAA